MNTRPLRASLALAFALYSCTSAPKPADTKEFVEARSQAESFVRLIKTYFKSSDLEYVQTARLYGELKASYDCILDAFLNAVSNGTDPNDERNFGTCAKTAHERRDDFVTFVRGALTAPRMNPQTNRMESVAERSQDVSNFVAAANQLLSLFEHLADVALKFRERYEKASQEERTKEMSRLQDLRWKNFEDIK